MPSINSCGGNGVYIPPDNNCDDCSAVRDQLDNVLTELDAVESTLDNKVDKVSGKGLSTNDYTNADKTKLNGIENGAQVNRTYNVVAGNPTGNAAPGFGDTVIVSQISQSATGQVSATDRTITIPNTVATTSRAGLMSAADKAKIANLETRLAALEALIGNKQNTIISMTDENNNVTAVTVLAE